MARKTTFLKEEILEKTSKFIEERGIEDLNARSLCKYIGCSTQPLFKNFNNMDNLKVELKEYLHNKYNEFINKIIDKKDYLYSISYAYALYAFKEPKSFNTLFMTELAGSRTIEEVLKSIQNIDTINSIPKQYNINIIEARELYRDVRFYTHGLSCQIATKSIIVKEEEISELIRGIIETKLNTLRLNNWGK